MPKNIIITGASSGIGRELALYYAKKSCNLLLIARNKDRLNAVVNLCTNKNNNIIAAICDVCDSEKLANIILNFEQKYKVDLIYANAGISAGTSLKNETLQQFNKILTTNIFGVANSIYPLIEHFKTRKSGQIIMISSMAALHALPSAPAYSCSKICVKYFGDSLRAELKKYNIKVNIIFPGYIKTAMTAKNKFPMPLLMDCNKAVHKIIKQVEKNKPYIIFPKTIYWVIKLVNMLPLYLQDKIFASLPKK